VFDSGREGCERSEAWGGEDQENVDPLAAHCPWSEERASAVRSCLRVQLRSWAKSDAHTSKVSPCQLERKGQVRLLWMEIEFVLDRDSSEAPDLAVRDADDHVKSIPLAT
jgi:hypothetical protein